MKISARTYLLILFIIGINLLHYLTPLNLPFLHDIYQRLYYLPIILAESYKQLQAQSDRIITIEEQLRRSEKLSTLGETAAVLAHEIRNPLGSIRGTAEILKEDYLPGDPKHEFIEIQIKETERLNRVVEDFLHMARPQPANMQSCPVQEELETIAALVANDARQQHVKSFFVIPAEGSKQRQ